MSNGGPEKYGEADLAPVDLTPPAIVALGVVDSGTAGDLRDNLNKEALSAIFDEDRPFEGE